MKFYTQYDRPEKAPFLEKIDKTCIVEVGGYIPAKDRIESLINAGRRLETYRIENYHFKAGEAVDENFSDPTTRKDFDVFEAKALEEKLNENFSQKMAEKTASEASGSTEQGVSKEDNDLVTPDDKSIPEGSGEV